jgi:hypothetical protein
MGQFAIRTELHNADRDDYERLHAALSQQGIHRTVESEKGQRQLPTGTYWYSGPQSSGRSICDIAAGIASKIKATPAPWIFVAGNDEGGHMTWWSSNLKAP